jgi:hypothetical protein
MTPELSAYIQKTWPFEPEVTFAEWAQKLANAKKRYDPNSK